MTYLEEHDKEIKLHFSGCDGENCSVVIRNLFENAAPVSLDRP